MHIYGYDFRVNIGNTSMHSSHAHTSRTCRIRQPSRDADSDPEHHYLRGNYCYVHNRNTHALDFKSLMIVNLISRYTYARLQVSYDYYTY
jgi:hypothetical protein